MVVLNQLQGLREFTTNQKDNPRYNKFRKNFEKSTGKTFLITDTYQEQMASVRNDGTLIPLGFITTEPYRNEGTIPRQLNLPISTNPHYNTQNENIKNTPRKDTTTLTKYQKELKNLEEINKPKPSQLRFITEEEYQNQKTTTANNIRPEFNRLYQNVIKGIEEKN